MPVKIPTCVPLSRRGIVYGCHVQTEILPVSHLKRYFAIQLFLFHYLAKLNEHHSYCEIRHRIFIIT